MDRGSFHFWRLMPLWATQMEVFRGTGGFLPVWRGGDKEELLFFPPRSQAPAWGRGGRRSFASGGRAGGEIRQTFYQALSSAGLSLAGRGSGRSAGLAFFAHPMGSRKLLPG